MIKLDLKDRRILYELDRNARQSNAQIAKTVRLNKNTVNYKINRLLEEGLIRGYYTVIDSSKLGYFSFRVYLKFFNTAPENEQEIIAWLMNNKMVGVVGKIETIYDLVLHVWVKSIYDFDDFWLEFKGKFRKYFWNEKVHVFSKVYHFKRKYLLDEKSGPNKAYELIGAKEIIKYDWLDFEILKLLSKNARMPLLDISEKLKTPPRTVAFRIKQLEKNGVIQGYRVNMDLEKMGYEYYKINIVLDDFENYDELLRFAKQHTNIIYIDRTLSDLDFEIDVEVKNRTELLELLGRIKTDFGIRDAEIFAYREYYKLEAIPEITARAKNL